MNQHLNKSLGTLTLAAALAALPLHLKAQSIVGSESLPQQAPAPAAAEEEATIMLSPFEVVDDAKGYFASNTMSGTRLNSKIEDLGQSITVMTKEQMSDFAMLDVNDVFDHMAGTEGTNSYSDFAVDRTGAVTDNVSLNPTTANRVRGLGSANIAFNNIPVSGRIPIDPSWVDSIELSRGANANIFGLGNAGGTVNQVAAMANLNKPFTRIGLRGDSYGGWRTSLDVNQVLIRNKFALRGSIVGQHTGFVRKPSGEDARRLSLQAKYQPFKGTTISLGYYGYRNKAERPNFAMPRDNITAWIAAGRPGWDPTTRLITMNGQIYGQGMVAGSTTPITTLPSSLTSNDSRSMFRIGTEGEAPYWAVPAVTSTTSPLASSTSTVKPYLVNTSSVNSYGAAQPLFASTASLSDKSVYDWEEINLQGNNFLWDDSHIYLAQLDQYFINNRIHTLAAQLSFMREDASRREDLPLGVASVNGAVGQVYADANIKNLDGSMNPYYGRPYLRSTEPFLRIKPLRWDTARAQLAYKFDPTSKSGWLKYVGTHQLLGYYEYKDRQERNFTYRHTAKNSTLPWYLSQINSNAPLANRTTSGTKYAASNNWMRVNEQYYVGSTPGGGIEYGPNLFPVDTVMPFVWGDWVGGTTSGFHYDPVQIGWTPSPDGTGSQAAKQTLIKTHGGLLQNTWYKGMFITTFGLRRDKVVDRFAVPATLLADFSDFDYAESSKWLQNWNRPASGKTTSISAVLRPFQEIPALKNKARDGSGLGGFAAELVQAMSLTYNKSDNFIPQGPAYDLMLRPLENQTGHSKEYGLWLTLFKGKMSLRYNHHNTKQLNKRDGDINTIAQRVLRADGLNAADRWNLQDRATDWVAWQNSWDKVNDAAKIRAEVNKVMGLPSEVVDALESAMASGQIAATQDVVARGDEFELNVNPTREWTISASFTKTESINMNAGSSIEEYINMRMPYWTTIEDPRFPDPDRPGHGRLWRTIYGKNMISSEGLPANNSAYGYDTNNSAASNYTTFVEGPLAVYRQTEGRPRPQMGKYAAKLSTRYQLSGITSHKILKNIGIGGSARWNDKKSIGYYGVQSLPNKITALDVNRPIWSPEKYYFDAFISYKTKLFRDKVRASFQFNVKNIQDSGGELITTSAFPDGTPLALRIVDPRQFILSVNLDL